MTNTFPDADALTRADDYCAEHPQGAAIRATLLDLERRAHATGWNGPDSMPRLFALNGRRRGNAVDHRWWDDFTLIVRLVADANDGRVGNGLQFLANHCENVTHLMRTGEVPKDWARDSEQLNEDPVVRKAREHFAGMKGFAGDDDHPFLGFGMRHEAFGLLASKSDGELQRYADEHRIHQHPQRVEMRLVTFVGSDGLLWWMQRLRGERPVVALYMPEGDMRQGGLVVNALSRMVNAVSANTIPVWELGPSISDLRST